MSRLLPLPLLSLTGYVLLSGLRNTALKGLQLYGSAHPIGGVNPISFCNVFLFSQLITGLAAVLGDRARVIEDIRSVQGTDRALLLADAFLGYTLGPIAFYQALDHLTVITQTLLSSLNLPISVLVARLCLGERPPRGFWLSCGLILAGLLLGKASGQMMSMDRMDDWLGVAWTLVAALAVGLRNVTKRQLANRNWGSGLTVGVQSLAGAIAFALIALQQYGPQHFFYLQVWWVLGVIGLYGFTLCLGTELCRQWSNRHYSVARISLAGSLALVVTVLSAAILLAEPLPLPVLLGSALILAGVLVSRRDSPAHSRPTEPDAAAG